MRHDPAAPPPVVLECEDLAFDYDTHKDAFGLRDVSLRLRAGRALGVIGLNGAGKSTLCKVLSAAELPGAAGGDWRPLRGRVAWRPRGGGAADAAEALHYVAPVGEKQAWVDRAMGVIGPFIDASG